MRDFLTCFPCGVYAIKLRVLYKRHIIIIMFVRLLFLCSLYTKYNNFVYTLECIYIFFLLQENGNSRLCLVTFKFNFLCFLYNSFRSYILQYIYSKITIFIYYSNIINIVFYFISQYYIIYIYRLTLITGKFLKIKTNPCKIILDKFKR